MKTYSLVTLALLAACSGSGNNPSNNIPVPGVGQWVDFGAGEPPINGTMFVFPSTQSGQWAGYFYTQLPAAPKLGQTLTLTYDVIGSNPQWVQNPNGGDSGAPTMHLFLWRNGDDMKCDQQTAPNQGGFADYRLFAARTPLVLGSGQTISAVLDPMVWTGCYGRSPLSMQDELSNLLGAGFTFGGANFAGHGVAISGGSAEFYIRGFSVK